MGWILCFGYYYLGYMDYVYTMFFLDMDLIMYMIWSDFVNRVNYLGPIS